MPLSITRRIHFCAGHRLLGHEGKCAQFHGHSFVAEFTVAPAEPDTLDDLGRIVDFSVLKQLFKGWIDEHWDHGFLLWSEDTAAVEALRSVEPHKLYVMDANPTSENMAAHLFHEICPPLLDPLGLRIVRVTIRESDDTSATVE